MAKQKEKNIFKIFTEGFKIYFQNFIPMTKGMLFPVFGQLIGIFIIFVFSYYYSMNLTIISPLLFNNLLLVFLGLIILTLPAFFLFGKAFWDYMLLMVSLNNLSENIINNGKLREISVHTQSVILRTKDYVVLLLILTLIWLIALFLPFAVLLFSEINQMLAMISFVAMESVFLFIATLVSVYLSLAFQVFAFENISQINVLKRSWNLVEGNFWRTIILCLGLYFTTSIVFTNVGRFVFNNDFCMSVFTKPVDAYLGILLKDQGVAKSLTDILVQAHLIKPGQDILNLLSETVVLATVDLAVIAMVLPLGSVCYTLLYKDIIFRREKKTVKKAVKKKA